MYSLVKTQRLEATNMRVHAACLSSSALSHSGKYFLLPFASDFIIPFFIYTCMNYNACIYYICIISSSDEGHLGYSIS